MIQERHMIEMEKNVNFYWLMFHFIQFVTGIMRYAPDEILILLTRKNLLLSQATSKIYYYLNSSDGNVHFQFQKIHPIKNYFINLLHDMPVQGGIKKKKT